MNPRFLPLALLSCLALLLSSCESNSSGYGYYLGELTDDTIVEFFKLNDDAASRQDYEFYKSFFAPNFTSIDRTETVRTAIHRGDYLAIVEDMFSTADSVHLQTHVRDIEYSESGYEATVKIHEEEKMERYGQTKHYTSLLDVELAIEDGWIFINKTTRTSMQVIEE